MTNEFLTEDKFKIHLEVELKQDARYDKLQRVTSTPKNFHRGSTFPLEGSLRAISYRVLTVAAMTSVNSRSPLS